MGVFNAFFFDEVTSRDYNLVIESKSILNAPEPDLQEYEIPGRDGTVFISNNRRRNVDISYTTFLRVPIQEDIQPYVTSIKNWLLAKPGQYLRLEDTYDLEHYRLATYRQGLDFEHTWRWYTRQTATFSCKPYRYLRDGDNRVTASAGQAVVYNPTMFDALPEIYLYLGQNYGGSSNITITYEDGTKYEQTVSGITRQYVGTNVILDAENQVVKAEFPEALINTAELAVFPSLKPGTNTISITGGGMSGFAVVPHWREL